jgi:ketosteroid isomerase-like protein
MDLKDWLDRYIAAWKSYDPQAIGDLFAEDAEYRYHPWDEPIKGREAIIAAWTDQPDTPGSWDASYEPYAVEGDKAVAIGTTKYFNSNGSTVDREYHNVFIMQFDHDGRCTNFTEHFMEAPHPGAKGSQ